MHRATSIFAVLLASVGVVLAQSTPLTETNDITQVDPYANPMKLMQANGYAHRVYARVGRTPFLLTNSGTFGIWWLRDFNVTTSYWLMATGTVRDATNGLMGFDVGPSQMQLPATSYWSIVRAYRSQAGVTTEIANLSYRLASVTATPEGAAQALVSPGSWPVNIDVSDLSGAVMSNQMGGGATWNGSAWTFGQDTNAAIVATGAWVRAVNASNRADAAYALAAAAPTGTPVYAESDPLWVASSNAFRDGLTVIGVKATNGATAYDWGDHAEAGYLTSESDPVWNSASNLYARRSGTAAAYSNKATAQAVTLAWTNGYLHEWAPRGYLYNTVNVAAASLAVDTMLLTVDCTGTLVIAAGNGVVSTAVTAGAWTPGSIRFDSPALTTNVWARRTF